MSYCQLGPWRWLLFLGLIVLLLPITGIASDPLPQYPPEHWEKDLLDKARQQMGGAEVDKILARQIHSRRYHELIRQYQTLQAHEESYFWSSTLSIMDDGSLLQLRRPILISDHQDEIAALDQAIIDRFKALKDTGSSPDETAERQKWWQETQRIMDQQWQRFLNRVKTEPNLGLRDNLLLNYDRQRRQALKQMETAAGSSDVEPHLPLTKEKMKEAMLAPYKYPIKEKKSEELISGPEDFLKASNYPSEMLADPSIGKVLKAYKTTLEAQRKKIAGFHRGWLEAPDSKSALYWLSECEKAKQEYARMLATYKENLDRLSASWKKAARRAAVSQDDKEVRAIKGKFDRARKDVKGHYQRELAAAMTDPQRKQALMEMFARSMAEVDRQESEALEQLKATRTGKPSQSEPAKPKTEPKGGPAPATAGPGR
jgi:hypothetical protein